MSDWKTLTDRKGVQYRVRWKGVNNVVVAYAYMQAMKENSVMRGTYGVREGGEVKGLAGVFDFSRHLNLSKGLYINRDKLRSRQQEIINEKIPWVCQWLPDDSRAMFRELSKLRKETLSMRAGHQSQFGSLTRHNHRFDISAIVLAEASKIVRDNAVASLAIVAAPAGGGLALAGVVLTGSGTAACKYQDTGNAKAAAMAGVGSVLMCGFNKIKLLETAGKDEKFIHSCMGVFIDQSTEFATATLEGKSNSEAMQAVLVKGLLDVGGICSQKAANRIVGKQVADLEALLEATVTDKKVIDNAHAIKYLKNAGSTFTQKGIAAGAKPIVEKGVGLHFPTKTNKPPKGKSRRRRPRYTTVNPALEHAFYVMKYALTFR